MKGCIDFTRWLVLLVPTLLTPGVCVCCQSGTQCTETPPVLPSDAHSIVETANTRQALSHVRQR
jgi:hypothetical protein